MCPRGTCEGSFPAPLEGLLRPTVELRLLGKESPVSAPMRGRLSVLRLLSPPMSQSSARLGAGEAGE